MDELRSLEATRQGSSPHSRLFPERDEGKRGSSQSQDPGLGLPADRSPWSRRLGRRTLGQAYPGHQGQPSSLPPALRLASAPSSRRGQTEAAAGHLRFEGAVWAGTTQKCQGAGRGVWRASALLPPPTSLAQLKAAKRLD